MILDFHPPYLNSAGPWATSKSDLQSFYHCPHTGAVTTRTSMLDGFKFDPSIHGMSYFDARSNAPLSERSPNANSSLNSLGYSPLRLDEVLGDVEEVARDAGAAGVRSKPFIISVTGTPDEVAQCYDRVRRCKQRTRLPLLLEVNLSCPNIKDSPPPAYEPVALQGYLSRLQHAIGSFDEGITALPVGIKLPPYTYAGQFEAVISTLLATISPNRSCPVSFITSTNTLGSCLLLTPSERPPPTHSGPSNPLYAPQIASASGLGHGGMGGTAIHPLSLGNVATLRRMLDQHEQLRGVEVVGTGGVADYAGAQRMKSVGARVVAVGTAAGKDGLEVFEKIAVEAGGEMDGDEVFGKGVR